MDIYVDPVSGVDDDSPARGQMSAPYRSLARAAERAAAEELTAGLPPGTFIGTIFALAGTYVPPVERFPIIVPPGYDLVGAGRDATIIRFTGETRSDPDSPTVTYWGGEAIYVGRNIRGMTVTGAPAPEYSCRGMIGVVVQNGSSMVEDLVVDLDQTVAPPPDEYGRYETSWMVLLDVLAVDLILVDSFFRDSRRDNGVIVGGCAGMITRCAFETAPPRFAGAREGLLVRGVAVWGAGRCVVSGPTRLESSRIGDFSFGLGVPDLWCYEGAVVGPNNTLEVSHMSAQGEVEISSNSLSHSWVFAIAGQVSLIDNQITPRAADHVLEIGYNSTNPGVPVIQGNRFVAPDRWGPHAINPIFVGASADFGGRESEGNNDFSRLFLSDWRPHTDAEGNMMTWGVIKIAPRAEDPPAEIRFDNNRWDNRYRADDIERFRFEIVNPPAVFTVNNPRRVVRPS